MAYDRRRAALVDIFCGGPLSALCGIGGLSPSPGGRRSYLHIFGRLARTVTPLRSATGTRDMNIPTQIGVDAVVTRSRKSYSPPFGTRLTGDHCRQ